MDQYACDLDHGDAVYDRVGCIAMLLQALGKVPSEYAGAGGETGSAIWRFATLRHVHSSSEDARPEP